MNKNPFTKIVSLVPFDFKYKVSESGPEYTIPKIATGTTEPTVTYNTTSEGAWKTDTTTTHTDYICVFNRASRKKTNHLPAPVADTVYFVTAEVAAVARKIEGRTDILTPADLIRARYNTNRYVRFLDATAVPST